MTAGRLGTSLDALAALLRATAAAEGARVDAIASRYVATLRGGGTLLFCGNGGSAADAQHCAAEYVVRYAATRRALPALALGTDAALVTAAGNDFGFEQVFVRQVEALGGPGDLLVLHSTSGRSPNLLAAARTARARGLATVAFLGKGGGELAALVDEALVVPSDDTGHIQLAHMAIEHVLVELVEAALAGPA
jgi:D-sedoheptulose 7-phosphate isomerase